MDHTKIAWADATWNPLVGCTKVSRGCANCYAERLVQGRLAHLYPELPDFAGGRQGQHVKLLTDRLDQPLRWRRPRRIFVNSMSDLFHDEVPDKFIVKVFAVMAASPQHTFMVLTKRPERLSILGRPGFPEQVDRSALEPDIYDGYVPPFIQPSANWPLPNVWLGVSIEDQVTADQRIPLLLQTPAALRWVSLEPQLEAVNLCPWLPCFEFDNRDDPFRWLDWVVQGGESGPRARPFDLAWARQVRDQCKAAGVPWFFKQAGAYVADTKESLTVKWDRALGDDFRFAHRAGADPAEWPEDLRVQAWPEVRA